jgi:hypothetical protein
VASLTVVALNRLHIRKSTDVCRLFDDETGTSVDAIGAISTDDNSKNTLLAFPLVGIQRPDPLLVGEDQKIKNSRRSRNGADAGSSGDSLFDFFDHRDHLRLRKLPRQVPRQPCNHEVMKALMDPNGTQVISKRVCKQSESTLSRAATRIAPIKARGEALVRQGSIGRIRLRREYIPDTIRAPDSLVDLHRPLNGNAGTFPARQVHIAIRS